MASSTQSQVRAIMRRPIGASQAPDDRRINVGQANRLELMGLTSDRSQPSTPMKVMVVGSRLGMACWPVLPA
jgi:hypothetical protein